MRFMVMHKMTEEMEKALPPDPAIMEGIGSLIQEGLKDNVFISGEGLKPTAERVRLVYKNGDRTVTGGSFPEAKPPIAGFVLTRVSSEEEAIAWCDKFAALLGDAELHLGPVVEPWDMGMMPKPENAPLRFLSTHLATPQTESDTPPNPALVAKIGALIDEMTKAGVLLGAGGLASTKKGARIRYSGGKRTVIDGPFAESKELIAGYAIVDLPSKAAAVEWSARFGEIAKVEEIDVRQLSD
jgi:hypothetical protein